MYLISLNSEPAGLFEPVLFKDGVNFIFGKKDSATDSKNSLNGIGKSTCLDLIDYCLLSDFNKSSRLKKEKSKLEGYKVVLEFGFYDEDITYVIKRSVDNLADAEFGTLNNVTTYSIQSLKPKLFDLIFNPSKYSGQLIEGWYRSILSFFMKVHKRQKGGTQFNDPIKYLGETTGLPELNRFHFYLLGLDNSIVVENCLLQDGVNDRNTTIREVKKLIEKKYSIDIKDVNGKLSKLRNDIKKAKDAINAFELASNHKDIEGQLNEYTFQIKELSESNFFDCKKVQSYKESYQIKDIIDNNKIRSIEKLYSELSGDLSFLIKKTLVEAVDFRKKLAESREAFLKDEIAKLEHEILKRDSLIAELDVKRANLFGFLKNKKAFSDLTDAFAFQVQKEGEFSELESNIKTYNDLEAEKQSWKARDAEMSLELKALLEREENKIIEFEEIFNFVYDNIYPKSASSGFTISPNYKSNAKIMISISFDHEESKGWNYGRTLVYDLAIMLNLIKQNTKSPRFLIHDGIFDGMDKAHFVEAYHFVKAMQNQGNRFQYIISINEEGTLDGNFGVTDDLTPEKIEQEAVLTLTPKKKFWKK